MSLILRMIDGGIFIECEEGVKCRCNGRVIKRASASGHVKSKMHIAWMNAQEDEKMEAKVVESKVEVVEGMRYLLRHPLFDANVLKMIKSFTLSPLDFLKSEDFKSTFFMRWNTHPEWIGYWAHYHPEAILDKHPTFEYYVDNFDECALVQIKIHHRVPARLVRDTEKSNERTICLALAKAGFKLNSNRQPMSGKVEVRITQHVEYTVENRKEFVFPLFPTKLSSNIKKCAEILKPSLLDNVSDSDMNVLARFINA